MWNLMRDWPTFFSVLSILLCLAVMIFFLLRMKFEQIFWRLPSTRFPFIPNREMKKVTNPYVLLFNDLDRTEIGDGVDVELTSSYPCHLTALWAVNIDNLHEALLQPSHTLLLQLHHREALQDTTQHIIDIPELCERKKFHLTCPSDVTGLGTSPRRLYPLVLILSLPLGLSHLEITDSHVVLSVYIMHLKDSECPRPSQLLNHYVKLYNGNLLNLQPLFLSSCKSDTKENSEQPSGNQFSESTTYNDQPTPVNSGNQPTPVNMANRAENVTSNMTVPRPTGHSDVNDRTIGDEDRCCIVCQSSVVSVVLLPCRHTCACEQCFVQLEKCPMCRATISSYFRLSDTESQRSTWESLNSTINDYLGMNSEQDLH